MLDDQAPGKLRQRDRQRPGRRGALSRDALRAALRRLRRAARRSQLRGHHALDSVRGRDPLLPPRALQERFGGGDFHQIGRNRVRSFVELADVQPDATVLEVGCGTGRMALPLTGHLRAGSYEGFDIVAEGVDWCRAEITPRFPNFRFRRADVGNAEYNPDGALDAAAYRFPYDDRSFDAVLLSSVFTHMVPAEVANYLREIARLLSGPESRCMATYFLINPESERGLESGRSALRFDRKRHDDQGRPYRSIGGGTAEAAVGLEESLVRDLYARSGQAIVEPVEYGTWAGRPSGRDFQDIVVSTPADQAP